MKKDYEVPLIEVIEFVLEESIATSATRANGVSLFEDIWSKGGS